MGTCETCKWLNVKGLCDRDDILCDSSYDEYEPKEKRSMKNGGQYYDNKIYNDLTKEKEMEKQKFQFDSEEQAIDIITIFRINSNRSDESILSMLKQNGYIRKSELQQMVEEAEIEYHKYKDGMQCLVLDTVSDMMNGAIQALKKSHPEFKK